jgi:nucleolar protein 14
VRRSAFDWLSIQAFTKNKKLASIVPARKSYLSEVSQAQTLLTSIFFVRIRRAEIPFVFEVPTTLDALHDMIASYATTGKDASLIIQRIYAANTVRLDRRNMEKMQNFYDVLLRRFVAVGDAIHQSGDGGAELGRFKQLDALTKVMYAMAQDSAESAGAVWSRRLGIFQNAHGKRLRDAEMEMVDDEEDFTAWPSLGVFFTLKALGHIFPVTDQRHHIVTPAILLLSQWVAQTPVLSMHDVVQGTLCSGLLIEYTREAKRIAPEALAFLAGVIRLFAHDDEQRLGPYPMPSLEAAARQESFASFRSAASQFKGTTPPLLSFEKSEMEDDAMPAALLFSVLHLVERLVDNLAGSVNTAEKELLAEITDSLLTLKPTSKKGTLPSILQKKVVSAAAALSKTCQLEETRVPVQHRSGPTLREKAIKTLAPRLENPDKYSLSKDKGKSSMQSATDRTRREYRREHKAVARELRMDGAFVENERRTEQDKKDSAARDKRQKNFAWLQEEQGAMNQQVRLGGDLIKGGGMGAAKAKVKSAKMGIKKGGKF